ncbi:uncharacterized protein LOC135346320 isoform X1 [Halichondria panicea]|uniref:uncharacterized protein LOC135346320 isoform X1 n=2 Tax=Halichondria panicea TaxID=6063 RepID=UPI00312B75E9
MQVKAVIITIQLFATSVAATLTSTSTVACPDDTVTFTCTLPGSLIRWMVTSPQLQVFTITVDTSNTDVTQGNPAFRSVFTDSSGGMVTANLVSLSEASIVEGTMVLCDGESSREGPLTITVADPPSPLLNPRVSFTLNQPSSSNITLEWDSPSSTGGVSVSYVLTISPTPLSGSPVTVETTSTQITISYNTLYNVTVRAVNCVGMNESLIVDLTPSCNTVVCPTPSTAAGVTIINTPPVTIGGSMLSFTCSGDNEVRTSTCGINGWSPDPGTVDCNSPVTDPPVTCSSPATPSGGCVDISGVPPPFSLGSEVIYRCDERLFPLDVRTSICTDVGGRGEWVENPGSLVCRERPVNCSLPEQPSNGTIVNYEGLNETVLEGTVLTYQCDNGLSLTGSNTIICTNAGVWNLEPSTIMCVSPTTVPLLADNVGAIAGGSLGSLFVVVVLVVVVFIVLVKKTKSSTQLSDNKVPKVAAGPVYEEVGLVTAQRTQDIQVVSNEAYGQMAKKNIELQSNQAYGELKYTA